MANTASIAAEANEVLAAIKGCPDKARVRELQAQYRKLSREYTKAERAAWASVPMSPELAA